MFVRPKIIFHFVFKTGDVKVLSQSSHLRTNFKYDEPIRYNFKYFATSDCVTVLIECKGAYTSQGYPPVAISLSAANCVYLTPRSSSCMHAAQPCKVSIHSSAGVFIFLMCSYLQGLLIKVTLKVNILHNLSCPFCQIPSIHRLNFSCSTLS